MKESCKLYVHKAPIRLECGATLNGVDIAYHTYGTLNEDASNVIWVLHALTADSDVAEWWPHTVESGKFLDPDKYFIVCANVLGSCYGTTGPESLHPISKRKWYDEFPRITIRDMVQCHRLLARHLGISQAYAIIGSSMGGYQALEWLVIDPNFAKRAVLIATGSHTRPWQAAFNETMRMAIEADPTYGTRSPEAGADGLGVARAIGLISYRGRTAYDLTQFDSEPRREIFQRTVHSYQRHQAQKLINRFNAYSYHRLCTAVDSHDIARGRAPRDMVLRGIRAKCLIIAITTDMLFPPCDHQDMFTHIPGAQYAEIESEFAHDGFLIEHEQLDQLIQTFFKQT